MVLYEDSQRKMPVVLIETKRKYDGSALALQQIKNYAKNAGVSTMKYLFVSDGLLYWLLERDFIYELF
ncbi:hypothetical protein GXP67_12435 [Rhodocytophaga rosea]|uniref:Type I restriction enzyme R protein N-terminal domain-containing protein n=1 Tax=Rhodocytophaga rosea TaxID=2704465 RepID=A0A6C0GHL2_9BACT|nr:hypothetical protein GXP67_12435 [Rhodocytophaga rosea]